MANELTTERRIEIESRADDLYDSNRKLSDMLADLIAEIDRLEEEVRGAELELEDQNFHG